MISRPTIFRAALCRFIPGVLAFLGCGLYLTARLKSITLGPAQVEGFTNLTLFMALGFVVSISAVRRALPRGAGVDGRRSVLAGFAAPALLLALEMLHGGPVSHTLNYGFAFAAGSAVSLAMFAPWVGRRAAPLAGGMAASGDIDADSGTFQSRAAPVVLLARWPSIAAASSHVRWS